MNKHEDLLANIKMAHRRLKKILYKEPKTNKEDLWYISDVLYDMQKFVEKNFYT